MRISIFFAMVALTAAISVCADRAPAEPTASALTLCNRLSDKVNIAIGYYSSGINDPGNVLTGPFVSRGWWTIESGQCRAFDNPFGARYMFWFGYQVSGLNDNPGKLLGSLQDSRPNFCVPDYFSLSNVPAFTYEDENASFKACYLQGMRYYVPVHKVDTFIETSAEITGQ